MNRRAVLGRSTRRAGSVAGLACLASSILGSATASASYGPPTAPVANPAFAVPLSGAVTVGGTTWATVLMGKDDGDFDLFWQLFSYDTATGQFALVTPPGVADNGGLMVAPTGARTSVLVGIGASQDLRFSLLAMTTNAGKSWSPGGLPDALAAAPSVLATSSRTAIALVGGTTQRVLARSGGPTDWTTLATAKAIASTPAGRTCAIGTLEAVALDPSQTPVVGASCRRPDTPGVFIDSDRQWHLEDIPVPTALANDAFATLRLTSSSALFAAVHSHETSIVAAWAPKPDRPWVMSSALRIAHASDLLASGSGSGTTQFVLIREDNTVRAETVAGPGKSWTALPALPSRVATIAIAPNGTIYALSVDVTKFTAWRLDPVSSSSRWSRTQTINVPIAFGTSS